MDLSSALHRATRLRTYVCSNCLLKRVRGPAVRRRQQLSGLGPQLRGIGDLQAAQRRSVLSVLEERGFINAIAGYIARIFRQIHH